MSFMLGIAWNPGADTADGSQPEQTRCAAPPKHTTATQGAPSPEEWLVTTRRDRPQLDGLTPWYAGSTTPKRIGWYERHFHYTSQILGCKSMNWWDGKQWRLGPHMEIHPRQVGSYPAWRGKMEST